MLSRGSAASRSWPRYLRNLGLQHVLQSLNKEKTQKIHSKFQKKNLTVASTNRGWFLSYFTDSVDWQKLVLVQQPNNVRDSDSEVLSLLYKIAAPSLGLPWWLRQWRICLQCRRPRFYPWVRKIPWRKEWLPTPVFLPGEFHGQEAPGRL